MIFNLIQPDIGGGKPEQEKTVNITENGQTIITPDSGNTLSKVIANIDVQGIDLPGLPNPFSVAISPGESYSRLRFYHYYYIYAKVGSQALFWNASAKVFGIFTFTSDSEGAGNMIINGTQYPAIYYASGPSEHTISNIGPLDDSSLVIPDLFPPGTYYILFCDVTVQEY